MTALDSAARDLAIRTIYGEAANEPELGQAAVAAVIRNRVLAGRYGGQDVPSVVMARNQFEPWARPEARSRMLSLAPSDPRYERIGSIVDRVFAGEADDPTGGATHFFSPTAQAGFGRQPPAWARGEPTVIGRHNFYAPEGRVAQVQEVTDPDVLARFTASRGGGEVTDPAVLERFRTSQADPPASFDEHFSAATAPSDSALPRAIADVPKEIYEASRTALTTIADNLNPFSEKRRAAIERQSKMGLVEGLGEGFRQTADVGAGLAAIPGLVSVPVVGAARSLIGHPYADVTGMPYEEAKGAVDTALMAAAPRSASPVGMRAIPPQTPAAAPPIGPGQEVAAAARRAGVELPRAVTSDMIGMQQTGKVAANVPLGGTPLRQAAGRALTQVDEAMTGAKAGYGSGDIAAAGAGAREGVDAAIRGPLKARVTALYDAVDGFVNPTVTQDMVNTRAVSNTIAGRRTLAALPESGAVKEIAEAINRPTGMTYEGVKTLRTYIGEMLDSDSPLPQGISHSELKQIYGALSKDLRLTIARAGGPDALRAYERAEREARRVADIRETLAPILKVRNDEGIVDRIVAAASTSSRADISLLGRARGAIGAERWDEIASAAISRLGRQADGNFSYDLFARDYGKLSAEGKRILFRSTNHTSHADVIDDIATIAQRMKQLNQFANPSGTGQTVLGGSIGYGALADPLTTVSAIVSARVLATILAKPAAARSMAAWSRAYARAATQPTNANIAGFLQASNLFAANIGREANRPDLIGGLARQLQGTIPAAPEENAAK